MRKDHGGGVHFDGFAYNFSRMHLNVAKSTRKKANLSTTEASEMMEIDRNLLSKPEHGKYVSIDKLAEIITYNISFIRGNSKGRISQQEILNEITT